jgi:hypothetical protein
MTLDVLSALIIGLLGSGHCLAMCGGITTMLTSAVKTSPTVHQSKNLPGDIPVKVLAEPISCSPVQTALPLICFYHIGRIASYCLIGAIVGLSGSLAAKNLGVPIAGLRFIAGVFVILLGLYIGQWLFWLNHLESVGQKLWRYLSPLAKHFIPVNSRKQAFGLGCLWGWLPCGLVYSTLVWALASGSPLHGAAIMLFFGLGTLPALLALSFGLGNIRKYLAMPKLRKLMALILIAYGLYSINLLR